MNREIPNLRQYLLGNLPEDEQERLELQFFTDGELLTNVEIAETELIEDYLDETLSAPELQQFEKLFLNSPERAKQILFLTQLRSYSPRKETAEKPSVDWSFAKLLAGLKDGISAALRPAVAVPALAILLIMVLGGWYLFKPAESQTDREVAQINQADLSNLSDYANLTRLILTPGVFRSNGGENVLNKKDVSQNVLIRLGLPAETTAETVQIIISKNSKTLSTLNNVKVYSGQAVRDVRILLPASLLTNGEYHIKLVGNEFAPVTYSFEVR